MIVILAGLAVVLLWWLAFRTPARRDSLHSDQPVLARDSESSSIDQSRTPHEEPDIVHVEPTVVHEVGAQERYVTARLAILEDLSAAAYDASSLPPATLLENIRSVFRQYQLRFGGNPVGTNVEITRALTSRNPTAAVFVNAEDGLRTNATGELVDTWGTPFFFHQLSGTEMEIHSAGPDRRMGTADDLVLR